MHIVEELDQAAEANPLVAGLLRRAANEIARLEGVVMGKRNVHQEMYGRRSSAPLNSAGPADFS